MKNIRILLVAFLSVEGCASAPVPLSKYGGDFTDHSPSAISEAQVRAIAEATIAKRERWPEHKVDADGIVHCVVYIPYRINNGGWRVIAHAADVDGYGACGYAAAAPAIIVISKEGVVTKYARTWVKGRMPMQGGGYQETYP
jgi:hypothetical protein